MPPRGVTTDWDLEAGDESPVSRPSSSGRRSRQWSRWRLRQRTKWSRDEKREPYEDRLRRESNTVEDRLLELEGRADQAEGEWAWWRLWWGRFKKIFELIEEFYVPFEGWLYSLSA